MPVLTGGQALVAQLLREGVEVIFGLPGVQLDWAFDALYEARDRIRVIHTRHEQATSYMADGYARSTGKLGVCLVVPGPGVLNAMAGLATAYACNSRVLCLTGQIPSDQIDKGRGLLHEIPHQLEVLRSVTKWAARALGPGAVPSLVHEACVQLKSGRPRPVALEIPPDVLQKTAEVELLPPASPELPEPDSELVEEAARLLGQAQQPLIFAGGGVLVAEAWDELRALAELLEAPVVLTMDGKGALDDRHDLAQNMVAARELTPQADVILVVGTRFLQPATSDWGPRQQAVIQLDIDPEEIGRNYPPTIGIVADAKRGLAALLNRLPLYNRRRESRRAELRALKERIFDLLWEVQPQASYAMAVREALPEEGILVSESTQVGYWTWNAFPVYRPRTFLTSGYQGTLGFGFATALGAKVGHPDRPVLSLNGDGGFFYNLPELATMVQHRLDVITVVFNDNAYGNVRRIQKERFGGRFIASDLYNPDFVLLAQSFGIEGVRVGTPEALRDVVKDAVRDPRPILIEVPVGEMPSIWGIVMAGRRS
ncbi:thiamine pyrophosphate-binding protein [Thermomicrobium sp. CFH 73360]|uniref:thiamine pyrophosphate-dependent enzyme n=1 Tax=Thermomicrobium sp. CFH 73360 TaxID=2951987 RepID=UPI002077041E|nr:thiamine pyrophosphate-dependent enzyme [Thermomicrobium sp. CFH 73360]MCM8747370.1 thiamine pyrophosphate-binding protein [Thermomicrobium sp. CFH 73360]